jgi:hypothetical protein
VIVPGAADDLDAERECCSGGSGADDCRRPAGKAERCRVADAVPRPLLFHLVMARRRPVEGRREDQAVRLEDPEDSPPIGIPAPEEAVDVGRRDEIVLVDDERTQSA